MKTEYLDMQSEKSLYIQVKDSLLNNLASQVNSEGKLPTFKEIAEKYNVSVVTVVKAIEKLKDEGVLYTRPGKGAYLISAEKTSETKTIAVVILDICNLSSSFLSELIKGIGQEGHGTNLNLQLFATPDKTLDFQGNSSFYAKIKRRSIDGLILEGRLPVKDVAPLLKEKIPFVWINGNLPGENIYSVTSDKFYSLNLIMAHLAKLKHRKICILSGEEDLDLKSAFEVLCSNYNLEGKFYMKEGPERDVGFVLTQEVLSNDKPDAIITRGSELTLSSMALITKLNVSVPKDLAVIGIVSSPDGYFSTQGITTLVTPVSAQARKAIQILQVIFDGGTVLEKKCFIPCRLLIRGSCGFSMKKKEEVVISNLEELKSLYYTERGEATKR